MYYIMHTDFAAPLTDIYPHAAKYDSDTLIIIGEMPKGFTGEIVRLCDLDITMEELTAKVAALKAEEHTGKLVMTSKAQGRWLRYNHPNFIREPKY